MSVAIRGTRLDSPRATPGTQGCPGSNTLLASHLSYPTNVALDGVSHFWTCLGELGGEDLGQPVEEPYFLPIDDAMLSVNVAQVHYPMLTLVENRAQRRETGYQLICLGGLWSVQIGAES